MQYTTRYNSDLIVGTKQEKILYLCVILQLYWLTYKETVHEILCFLKTILPRGPPLVSFEPFYFFPKIREHIGRFVIYSTLAKC